MEEIIIIGGKGTAVSIAEQIDDAYRRFGSQQRVHGFAIDDPSLGRSIAGFPVVCGTREVGGHSARTGARVIFALYRPDVMKERIALLASYGLPHDCFARFVHPLAYVAPSAKIGAGSVVFAHASVMKGSVIGDFSIVNSQVTVEHDTSVGDSAFLSAGACVGSEMMLGRGVFVGMNATLRPGTTIGDFAMIGMGAVVTRSVEEGVRVYGNPARSAG